MNFFKLKIFVTVCNTRSFTKAAEQLFITQSAVSKSIKELEASWEIKLILRKGNQIDITADGKSILIHALNLLNNYSSLEAALNTLKSQRENEIKLGSGSSVTKFVLENVVRFFFEKFPEVELEIHAGNSESTEALLKTGYLDYGIVASTVISPELTYLPITDDIILPVCHIEHPLADKTVSAAELLNYPVFAREKGSATQDAINAFFSDHGLHFEIKNSINYNESLLSYLILEKQHIGFISTAEMAQKTIWQQVKVLTLKEGVISRKLYLAYQKSNFDPVFLSEMKRAIDLMKKSWA